MSPGQRSVDRAPDVRRRHAVHRHRPGRRHGERLGSRPGRERPVRIARAHGEGVGHPRRERRRHRHRGRPLRREDLLRVALQHLAVRVDAQLVGRLLTVEVHRRRPAQRHVRGVERPRVRRQHRRGRRVVHARELPLDRPVLGHRDEAAVGHHRRGERPPGRRSGRRRRAPVAGVEDADRAAQARRPPPEARSPRRSRTPRASGRRRRAARRSGCRTRRARRDAARRPRRSSGRAPGPTRATGTGRPGRRRRCRGRRRAASPARPARPPRRTTTPPAAGEIGVPARSGSGAGRLDRPPRHRSPGRRVDRVHPIAVVAARQVDVPAGNQRRGDVDDAVRAGSPSAARPVAASNA